eukprot:Nitzschia sp. Nitz4//scaffold170_size48074//24898//25737//NITZ4_007106-RA/size48074-processed-gene-0.13-mRNA-1//1//CDS//3329538643//1341//frame0
MPSDIQPHGRRVKGWYIHRHSKLNPTDKVIFWLYGGAYLGGDVRGNSSTADWVASQVDMDVFIPNTRLAPESTLDDILWDVALSYKWLCSQLSNPSEQILIWGISSGAGSATLFMQQLCEYKRGDTTVVPSYFAPLLDSPLPKAGILFGPFVDLVNTNDGSFLHYSKVDLVVTESVINNSLPYVDAFVPDHPDLDNPRKAYSAAHRSLKGLPPLCVIASSHEAVYDMSMHLVNQGRSEGVDVTFAVFKYVCHVFSFLHGFIPEGRISLEFACDWIYRNM